MTNNKKAFTVMESMITLVVIGIIAVLTIASTINIEKININKMNALSKIFYPEVESAYAQILYNETKYNNIVNIESLKDVQLEELPEGASEEEKKEAKKTYIREQSNIIFDFLQRYLTVNTIPCEKVFNSTFPDNQIATLGEGGHICFTTDKNLNGILRFNKDCDETYYTIPYYKEDGTPVEQQNLCGYFAYASKNSRFVLGKDLFIIGLKKRNIE